MPFPNISRHFVDSFSCHGATLQGDHRLANAAHAHASLDADVAVLAPA